MRWTLQEAEFRRVHRTPGAAPAWCRVHDAPCLCLPAYKGMPQHGQGQAMKVSPTGGAPGSSARVQGCTRVTVIATAVRVCIESCHECTFYLGVNRAPSPGRPQSLHPGESTQVKRMGARPLRLAAPQQLSPLAACQHGCMLCGPCCPQTSFAAHLSWGCIIPGQPHQAQQQPCNPLSSACAGSWRPTTRSTSGSAATWPRQAWRWTPTCGTGLSRWPAHMLQLLPTPRPAWRQVCAPAPAVETRAMLCGIPRCPGRDGVGCKRRLGEGACLSACLLDSSRWGPGGVAFGRATVRWAAGERSRSGAPDHRWPCGGRPSDAQALGMPGAKRTRKGVSGPKHAPWALTGAARCRQLGHGAPPRAAAAPGQPGALPDPLQGRRGGPCVGAQLPTAPRARPAWNGSPPVPRPRPPTRAPLNPTP